MISHLGAAVFACAASSSTALPHPFYSRVAGRELSAASALQTESQDHSYALIDSEGLIDTGADSAGRQTPAPVIDAAPCLEGVCAVSIYTEPNYEGIGTCTHGPAQCPDAHTCSSGCVAWGTQQSFKVGMQAALKLYSSSDCAGNPAVYTSEMPAIDADMRIGSYQVARIGTLGEAPTPAGATPPAVTGASNPAAAATTAAPAAGTTTTGAAPTAEVGTTTPTTATTVAATSTAAPATTAASTAAANTADNTTDANATTANTTDNVTAANTTAPNTTGANTTVAANPTAADPTACADKGATVDGQTCEKYKSYSNTCSMGKTISVRRRTMAGDAHDNCRLSCGYCVEGQQDPGMTTTAPP